MQLLDLLLPRRCLVCSRAGAIVCAPCSERLPRVREPLCARCGAPVAWPVARCRECAGRRLAFASARAAVRYDDRVRRVVSGWKEQGLRGLSALAADVVAHELAPPRAQVLAFVPPDGARSLQRGHHPAQRLALELGERWGLPVAPLLVRARAARPQRGLSLDERRRNVERIFDTRGEVPARVALVDDVYTTGATATSAASALRHAGARHVEVVTFARTIRS